MASLIGHGLCSRFPELRFAPVENGSNWVRPLLRDMEHAYTAAPHAFDEDPVEVFKRNIYVHPFHEEDPIGLVEHPGRRPGAVRIGLPPPRRACPTPSASSTSSTALPHDDVVKIMGGNLNQLMKLDVA